MRSLPRGSFLSYNSGPHRRFSSALFKELCSIERDRLSSAEVMGDSSIMLARVSFSELLKASGIVKMASYCMPLLIAI